MGVQGWVGVTFWSHFKVKWSALQSFIQPMALGGCCIQGVWYWFQFLVCFVLSSTRSKLHSFVQVGISLWKNIMAFISTHCVPCNVCRGIVGLTTFRRSPLINSRCELEAFSETLSHHLEVITSNYEPSSGHSKEFLGKCAIPPYFSFAEKQT